MTSTEEVTPDMLAALAERFANGATLNEDEPAWTCPEYEQPTYDVQKPLRFELPGFGGERNVIGTDGSVTTDKDLGAFAAVHADGYVTVGTFTGPRPNSQTAEMQAIRYALRRSGEGPVTLLLDNDQVIAAVQRMAHTGRPAAGHCLDRATVDEVANLLLRRPATVRHVPDVEGTTTWNRLPSNPLMGAAHRLAWSARRMRADGIPMSGPAVEWLQAIALSGIRNASGLRSRYERFRRSVQ